MSEGLSTSDIVIPETPPALSNVSAAEFVSIPVGTDVCRVQRRSGTPVESPEKRYGRLDFGKDGHDQEILRDFDPLHDDVAEGDSGPNTSNVDATDDFKEAYSVRETQLDGYVAENEAEFLSKGDHNNGGVTTEPEDSRVSKGKPTAALIRFFGIPYRCRRYFFLNCLAMEHQIVKSTASKKNKQTDWTEKERKKQKVHTREKVVFTNGMKSSKV